MARISLLDLQPEALDGGLKGLKLFVYGGNSRGKTQQCMKMEKPLLLMVESGGSAISGHKIPVNNWAEFKTLVAELTNEKTLSKMQEKYQTIIIDTVSPLIGLAEDATASDFGVRHISEIDGRKNGYSIYRKEFERLINQLCSKKYTVIFIDHETIGKQVDEITQEEYPYIQPKGSDKEKGSSRFVRDICDVVAYIKANPVDETGATVYSTAICKETRNCFARTRYDALPAFITPFTAQNFSGAIIKAREENAKEQNAEIVEYEYKDMSYTVDDYKELIKPYFKKLQSMFKTDVLNIIASQLGDRPISSCTEDDIVALETIYNNLLTLADVNKITV